LDSDGVDSAGFDSVFAPLSVLLAVVVAADDFLLSVMYQPEPLKIMPVGWSTRFNAG